MTTRGYVFSYPHKAKEHHFFNERDLKRVPQEYFRLPQVTSNAHPGITFTANGHNSMYERHTVGLCASRIKSRTVRVVFV